MASLEDRIQIDQYFTDEGRYHIMKAIEIFTKLDISHYADSEKTIEIDEDIFYKDEDTSPYIYNVKFKQNGMDVQLISKQDTSRTMYMFGVLVPSNTKEQIHVYHHPYGPFKIFGFDYELRDGGEIGCEADLPSGANFAFSNPECASIAV